MNTPGNLPDLMSLREASELAGLHLNTIRMWIKSGRLPVVRLGPQTVRVRRSVLVPKIARLQRVTQLRKELAEAEAALARLGFPKARRRRMAA